MIGAVRIRTKSGKSLSLIMKEFIVPLSNKHAIILSQATVKEIQEQISASLVRPGSTGKLMTSFFAEKTLLGYGVGNIDYLNQNAPYWYWQNYGVAQTGRRIPPRTTGHFVPGDPHPNAGEFRNGRFQHEVTTSLALLQPAKPLEAKNYIEKTLARIFAQAPTLISGIK